MKKIIVLILTLSLLLTSLLSLSSCDDLDSLLNANSIIYVQNIEIDDDGNLIVIYSDGHSENLGPAVSSDDPEATTHDWSFSSSIKPATCLDEGVDLYSCDDCGLLKIEDVGFGDHVYSDWIIDKEATGKEEGRRHKECTLCGAFGKEEVISRLPYDDYKLGMGVVVDMSSSRNGYAQVDSTVATVVTDADGKIVACRIDIAQNKMTVTDGAVELDKIFKTKMELGDAYNMAAYGLDNNGDGIVLEWYLQAKAFEEYVVGMTAAEVQNIKTQDISGRFIAVDDALLSAGCTIQITEFISAVVKACNDEQGMSFNAPSNFTLGVAANSTVDPATTFATEDSNGTVAMYTDFAASVVVDGKIAASINDATQPKISFDIEGNIIETSFKATKRELKESYNMSAYGIDNNGDGIVREWYLQSEAFSEHVVGMTADEVANMATLTNDYGYIISADDDLLSAGCTIQITGIKAVVAKSADYAH